MLIRLFFISLFTMLFAKNSDWFITNYEYGKMLYNNPRGISCAKCHGKKGEGKIITYYISSDKEKKVIKTVPFKKLDFEWFKKVLFHKLKIKKILHENPDSPLRHVRIMPKYDYLTDDEIKAILLYLKKEN